MQVNSWKCESCGKTTFNRRSEKNWLIIDGSITRAHGTGDDEYTYLTSSSRDFCSLKCFAKALGLDVKTAK